MAGRGQNDRPLNLFQRACRDVRRDSEPARGGPVPIASNLARVSRRDAMRLPQGRGTPPPEPEFPPSWLYNSPEARNRRLRVVEREVALMRSRPDYNGNVVPGDVFHELLYLRSCVAWEATALERSRRDTLLSLSSVRSVTEWRYDPMIQCGSFVRLPEPWTLWSYDPPPIPTPAAERFLQPFQHNWVRFMDVSPYNWTGRIIQMALQRSAPDWWHADVYSPFGVYREYFWTVVELDEEIFYRRS